MRRIGELLVAKGTVTEAAVARALHYQRMSGCGLRIGTILLNWDLLPEERLIEELGKLHRSEPVFWAALAATRPEVARLLPPGAAIRLGALPYAIERSGVRVAFLNPSDLAAVDEVGALLRRRILAGVTSEVRLLQAHHKFYGRPLTQETRGIIHKLQRRPAASSPSLRLRTPGEAVDFRGPDLLQSDPRAAAADLPSPRPPDSEAVEIPVATVSVSTRSPDAGQRGGGLPPPPDFYAPEPAPEFPLPELAAAQGPPSGDELREWVGDALGSFQRDVLRAAEAESPEAAHEAEAEEIPALESAPPPLPVLEEPPAAAPRISAVDRTGNGGHWRTPRFDDEEDAAVSGMWTGPDTLLVPLPEGHSRGEIAAAVVESQLKEIPRALVLGSTREGTVAWFARGLDPGADAADLWIPAHERSIFAHVARTDAPHFGPLDLELWPRALVEMLGAKPPECGVFPVRVRDAVAAFLYADRGSGEPMLYEDFGVLTRAAAILGASLSRFLLNSSSSASAPVR